MKVLGKETEICLVEEDTSIFTIYYSISEEIWLPFLFDKWELFEVIWMEMGMDWYSNNAFTAVWSNNKKNSYTLSCIVLNVYAPSLT